MDRCKGCLWFGSCYSVKNDCEHYTAVDEREVLDEYINARSDEFYTEWIAYIEEYGHSH